MNNVTSNDTAHDGIELPLPTAAPIVLATGIVLLFAGIAMSYAMSAVGAILIVVGLRVWIGHLLPGRGHFQIDPTFRPDGPKAAQSAPGTVEQLTVGMPGYRMRLPLKVHPISAGIKGGIVGGLVMAIPALAWGYVSGHGVWYPINLLAGMVVPGLAKLSVAELEGYRMPLLITATVIHALMSLVIGLIYGVLLPTLPPIFGSQFMWGALVLPLIWTGASYGLTGVVNPVLQERVDWPWFIASQFVFGIAAASVVMMTEQIAIPPAGQASDTESLTR